MSGGKKLQRNTIDNVIYVHFKDCCSSTFFPTVKKPELGTGKSRIKISLQGGEPMPHCVPWNVGTVIWQLPGNFLKCSCKEPLNFSPLQSLPLLPLGCLCCLPTTVITKQPNLSNSKCC